MTNVVILAGLLFAEMALSAQSSVAGTNDVLSEVTRSAQEGLRRYLIEVPKREIEDCGLPTGVTPERLSLSRPFQVHSISPDVLSNLTSVTSTEQLLIPTTQYYVPVLVDGIPRSILIVDRVQDQWKAVSFGHAILATALSRLLTNWPESRGFHPKLIVVPQAHEVLFTVPEVSATNLTRLPLHAQPFSQTGEPPSNEIILTEFRAVLAGLMHSGNAGKDGRTP